MVYKRMRIDITEKQVMHALKGKAVRLSPGQINSGDTFVSLHPANAKKVESAFLKHKGTTLHLSHGELLDTAASMEGSGFWSNVWNAVKKGWGALKKSGVLSTVADLAVAPAAAYTGQPALVGAARKMLKDTTGIGIQRMSKSDKYDALRGAGIYLS